MSHRIDPDNPRKADASLSGSSGSDADRGSATPGDSADAQIRVFIQTLVRDRYLDTEEERKVFLKAAELGLAPAAVDQILAEELESRGAVRGRLIIEQFRPIVVASIRDRYLDRNEEGNLLAWALNNGMPRDVALGVIEDECYRAGAGRRSTGSKPLSEFRYRLIGAGICIVLVLGFIGLLKITGPRTRVLSPADHERVESYYQRALASLEREAMLLPANDSVHFWMQQIAKIDPGHSRLLEVKEEQRKLYIRKADANIAEHPSEAIRFAELAAAIRPGEDVEAIVGKAKGMSDVP